MEYCVRSCCSSCGRDRSVSNPIPGRLGGMEKRLGKCGKERIEDWSRQNSLSASCARAEEAVGSNGTGREGLCGRLSLLTTVSDDVWRAAPFRFLPQGSTSRLQSCPALPSRFRAAGTVYHLDTVRLDGPDNLARWTALCGFPRSTDGADYSRAGNAGGTMSPPTDTRAGRTREGGGKPSIPPFAQGEQPRGGLRACPQRVASHSRSLFPRPCTPRTHAHVLPRCKGMALCPLSDGPSPDVRDLRVTFPLVTVHHVLDQPSFLLVQDGLRSTNVPTRQRRGCQPSGRCRE